MSASNREPSIRVTLGYEGGYTNDPRDPGGPTNWGITIHDAKRYWKADATAGDVRAMPIDVAIDIYRKRYWAPLNCDNDPAGVDLVTFDYGVNSGNGRAGPVRDRLRSADSVVWVKAICAERLSFLQHLKTWAVFGRGWGSRVASVEAKGVRMALQTRGHAPETVQQHMDAHGAGAKTSSLTHAAGATGGLLSLAWLPHLDPAVWTALALLGFPTLLYSVWWAWHHFLRSKAYAHG